MIVLEYPLVLLLVLLPLVLRPLLPPYQEAQAAVRVPWFERMAGLLRLEPGAGSVVHKTRPLRLLVGMAGWALLVLALARPQFLEPPVTRTLPTRDILLLVDLSGSMEARDFTTDEGQAVDRLEAVKRVLDEFLDRRQGDRVGLVVFGNAAFVQVPFTQDLASCRILLEEMQVRMAGPRTAFGDAIGLGITLFERSELEERVIIALTDGNDTGSRIPPREAAKIARDREIVVHVVGVGDPAAVGEEELDEEALRDVASSTGGAYFFAADRERLESIYLEIDRIGAREVESESYRPRTELFHWPLAAVLLGGLFLHVRPGRGKREGGADG